jgi:hypothetical protein
VIIVKAFIVLDEGSPSEVFLERSDAEDHLSGTTRTGPIVEGVFVAPDAQLAAAGARLEKWANAERATSEEPYPPPTRGIKLVQWARVPEGE